MTALYRRRASGLALFASITVVSSAYGADAQLKVVPFWESIQQDVDVSGFVVAGLTTSSLLSGSDLTGLYVRPPRSMKGAELCLTVQSRDGVYLSRNTYVLPDDLDGSRVNLSYSQSSALDLLKSYDDGQLAVSVTGGNCETPKSTYLRPHGPKRTTRNTVDLMINGFGATDVFYSAPTLNTNGDCTPLHDGRTTVFDFWCRVAVPGSFKQALKIRVERERYGRPLPPATVVVAGYPS